MSKGGCTGTSHWPKWAARLTCRTETHSARFRLRVWTLHLPIPAFGYFGKLVFLFSFLLGKRFKRSLLNLVVGRECFEILVVPYRKSLSSLPVSAQWTCSLPSWCIARIGMGISDKRASHVFGNSGNFMFSTLGRGLNRVLFSCQYSIPKEDSWLD